MSLAYRSEINQDPVYVQAQVHVSFAAHVCLSRYLEGSSEDFATLLPLGGANVFIRNYNVCRMQMAINSCRSFVAHNLLFVFDCDLSVSLAGCLVSPLLKRHCHLNSRTIL